MICYPNAELEVSGIEIHMRSEENIRTPFVIYAGSNRPEDKRQAQREGAQGSANNLLELYELVIGAIKGA